MDNPFKGQYLTFTEICAETSLSVSGVRNYLVQLGIRPVERFGSLSLYPIDTILRIEESRNKPRSASGPRPSWTPNQIAKMIHYAQAGGDNETYHDLIRRYELQGLVVGAITELKMVAFRNSVSRGVLYSWDQVQGIAGKFACDVKPEYTNIL